MDKKRAWASIITLILGIISIFLNNSYTGEFWNRYTTISIILIIASFIIWPREEEKEEEFKGEPRNDFEVD